MKFSSGYFLFSNFFFSTCFTALILLISMPCSADPTPEAAQLNPDFLNFQVQKQITRLQALESAPSGSTLGFIPSPIDYSYLKTFVPGIQKSMSIVNSSPLPTSYDLRTAPGYVTPVKNQGSCGACWSFASISSIESDLLFQKGETWNFSENNLKNTHGFDWGHCAVELGIKNLEWQKGKSFSGWKGEWWCFLFVKRKI